MNEKALQAAIDMNNQLFRLQRRIEDLSMLVSFLAGYSTDVHTKRYEALAIRDDEEMRIFLTLNFPVLQGTENTLKLKQVSQLPYDQDALHRAMEYLLSKAETQED